MATDVALPHVITNGPFQDANQVMANLNAIKNWLNTNAVQLDASKATTGTLSGPASDPSTSNQYARKAYVDATDLGNVRMGCSISGSQVCTDGTGMANMTFANEASDTHGFHSPGGQNIVIPTGCAGVYLISVYANVTGSGSNLRIHLNCTGTGVPTAIYGFEMLDGTVVGGAAAQGIISRIMYLPDLCSMQVYISNNSTFGSKTFDVDWTIVRLSV
jgi:hypothetical protein